jgi:DNA polymerase III alpha subunit
VDRSAETLERHLREAGLRSPGSARLRQFGQLWQRMQDLPRHLGQHSGGMVVCQGRLDEIVPLENASMPGRVVVQWDKDDCADMGIIKVDLLGLGMMAVLQDAIELVNATGSQNGLRAPRGQGPEMLDLARLPADDPAVYRMLQEADTIGVFQVESRAQMATLPRLRPGLLLRHRRRGGDHPARADRRGRWCIPISSGGGHRAGDVPHPSLEPILRRTLGVPLFQEQLLRMAMVAAGFHRRARPRSCGARSGSSAPRSGCSRHRGQAARRHGRQGITGRRQRSIVQSITSFALYGFPESHAASFALLVYASAYLKAHFPAAFYTAMLNNQPMGFYHPATLVKDAQRHGVRFAPIDVQVSAGTDVRPVADHQLPVAGYQLPAPDDRSPIADSPLRPMTPAERLMADYAGTSLTIGPHPLALRRRELATRGVLRAVDLPSGRHGRRVRVAGAVITRQRPGTAKGFVFLTLEDETGIANIIVRPDLFTEQRAVIVGAPYLIVEGALQIQEGVTSVKAERVLPLGGGPVPASHDFC